MNKNVLCFSALGSNAIFKPDLVCRKYVRCNILLDLAVKFSVFMKRSASCYNRV